MTIMKTAIMTGIVLVACMLSGVLVSGCISSCSLVTTKTDIASISDSTGVHGQFVLGFGQIDSQLEYYFYEGNAQSGYRLKYIPADKVIVYPDEDESPYMTDTYNDCGGIEKYKEHFYTIHVPHDAIKRDYILNGV